MPLTQTTQEPITATCQHCGHTGVDVGLHSAYRGGHGYETHTWCNDAATCGRRWDRAHGLDFKEALRCRR